VTALRRAAAPIPPVGAVFVPILVLVLVFVFDFFVAMFPLQ
jgi:hypothetical protein